MGNALSAYELSNYLLKPNMSPDNLFGLTNVQIRLIRKSWHLARKQGMDEPGRSILLAILKKAPEIERKFGSRKAYEAILKGKNVTGGQKPEFYLHAQRFTALLDLVIRNLEYLPSLGPRLMALGWRHAEIAAFQSHYWEAFAEALIDKSLNWGTGFRNHRNSAMRIAWIKIVLFITEKFNEGYSDYYRQVRRSISTTRERSVSRRRRYRFGRSFSQ